MDNSKKAKEIFTAHQATMYHKNCVLAYENRQKILEGVQDNVIDLLDENRKTLAKQNRDKILPIIEAIILCGRQDISLRGHRDFGEIKIDESSINEGNFREILKYRAKGDSHLKDTLEISNKRERYTSPIIQNDIISSINTVMLKQLVLKINSAGAFSLLVDETTDISTTEQISLCARYVHENKIHEDFLQFVPAESLTGYSLSNVILSNLEHFGIDLNNMVGQGYDGASNMSGRFNGVQAFIRQRCDKAIYVHCAAHSLNLAVSKACEVQQIRNSLGVIEKLYVFFNTPKRKNLLLKKIDESQENPSTKTLKRLCATRWTSKYEAVKDFVELYYYVFESLNEITSWIDSGDAPMLKSSIVDSEFLVALHVINQIFSYGLPLCRILQTVDIDLQDAIVHTENTIACLEELRQNSEKQFEDLFDKAKEFAFNVGVEIKLKRITQRQKNRPNPDIDFDSTTSISNYFRITIYLPFLDFFINQLKERFSNHKEIFNGFVGLFSLPHTDSNDNQYDNLLNLYLPDIPKENIKIEIKSGTNI